MTTISWAVDIGQFNTLQIVVEHSSPDLQKPANTYPLRVLNPRPDLAGIFHFLRSDPGHQ